MMDIKQRHDAVVRQLIERYRAMGYTVQEEPQIVESAGGKLVPDFLATRGGETVLVEVKLSRPTSSSTTLRRLADVAHKNNWRFVIAVVDEKDFQEVEVGSEADARRKLAEARALDPSSSSAPLLAWAVLESATRLALVNSGSRILKSATPLALIQQLGALGLVSNDEENALRSFALARNRIAHGFWATTLAEDRVPLVLDIAERLLAGTDIPPSE
jgi:hypothetical protein